jgi:hypothetical protein
VTGFAPASTDRLTLIGEPALKMAAARPSVVLDNSPAGPIQDEAAGYGSRHHGVDILPSHPVARTIKAVAEGRDEILETGLELARQPRQAGSQPSIVIGGKDSSGPDRG